MNRLLAVAVLLAVAASGFLECCSRRQKISLAITHVALIDATGAPAQPDVTVLIKDQKIISIGPSKSLAIPEGAQILDATGKFLIPGLADMHVHLTGASEPGGSREFLIPLLLANGITTVRDMGGYLESLIPLRKEIRNGQRLGPEMVIAGPYLDGSPPSFQPSFVVSSAVEASADVHELMQRGVDFIKVQSILSRTAYFAIAAACKREHISFVGHVPDHVTAGEASDAGQKSIEHLTGELRACSNDEQKLIRKQFIATPKKETESQSHARQVAWQRELLSTYSDARAHELIEKFLRNQTWQVPTLIVLKNDAYPTPEADPSHDARIKYIPKKLLENWKKGTGEHDKGVTLDEFELRKAMLAKSLQFVGKTNQAGVRIMAGTDTTAPYVFPGSSLHEELALLVQAGLTPMQALQAATSNPAEFLGKLQTQGTIETGKYADLLLLDANPLDDIRNTQKIHALVIRGRLLDKNAIDKMLRSEIEFASKN